MRCVRITDARLRMRRHSAPSRTRTMKPFAKKLERIPCPRCGEANVDVFLKGTANEVGRVAKVLRTIGPCSICHYASSDELDADKLEKVETNSPAIMKNKSMYKIQATRTIAEEQWHWIKWTGSWDDGVMGELTKAINEACKTSSTIKGEDGETEEVVESGMYLDRSGEKAMLLIRDDCLSSFEDVLDTPIFQDAFHPFARVSEEKIEALRKAFGDAE